MRTVQLNILERSHLGKICGCIDGLDFHLKWDMIFDCLLTDRGISEVAKSLAGEVIKKYPKRCLKFDRRSYGITFITYSNVQVILDADPDRLSVNLRIDFGRDSREFAGWICATIFKLDEHNEIGSDIMRDYLVDGRGLIRPIPIEDTKKIRHKIENALRTEAGPAELAAIATFLKV